MPGTAQPEDSQKVSLRITYPEQHLALVEVNNLSSQNEFTSASWRRLEASFDSFSQDPLVRAVILCIDTAKISGSTNIMASWIADLDPDVNNSMNTEGPEVAIAAIEKCFKPVVCVLHGRFSNTGLQFACASDIRICTHETQFCTRDEGEGYTSSLDVMNGMSHLTDNQSLLREVCMTGKDFSGEDARRLGLVSSVWDGKREALSKGWKIATMITERDDRGVGGIRLLKLDMRGQGKPDRKNEYSEKEKAMALDKVVGSKVSKRPLEKSKL